MGHLIKFLIFLDITITIFLFFSQMNTIANLVMMSVFPLNSISVFS